MKRYVAEPGSDVVRDAMREASLWFTCRVAFVETYRAVNLEVGRKVAQTVVNEWPSFAVVDVDQQLVEAAADLTSRHPLRSLDALHLAAALFVTRDDVRVATWDRRLHAAARAEGLDVLPEAV